MKNIARKVLKHMLALNSAEVALLSFLSVSLLGAVALMVTERGHSTTDPYPAHQEVIVYAVDTGVQRREVQTTVRFTENQGLRFVDAWFTSVSALCVTGLTTIVLFGYLAE